MEWATEDLDAIEAMDTGVSCLQSIPDVQRRFLLSVLAELGTFPPMLDGVEDEPATDERLIDWIHGARASLLAPSYECPSGGDMEIIYVVHDATADGGSSVVDTWTEIDSFSSIERDDTGEVYFVNEGGYDQLSLPAGRYHVLARHTMLCISNGTERHARLKVRETNGAWEILGETLGWFGTGVHPYLSAQAEGDFDLTVRKSIAVWGLLPYTRSGDAWGSYTASYGGRFGGLMLMRKDIPG